MPETFSTTVTLTRVMKTHKYEIEFVATLRLTSKPNSFKLVVFTH